MVKVIKLVNGKKIFEIGNKKIVALNNASIDFELGKLYLIMGHSGSGKSTLIQILGLLDNLSSGELYINDVDDNTLTDNEKADIRMKNIGFVFQSYFLNKNINALDNIIMPMYVNPEIKRTQRKEKAINLLKMVGLEERKNHLPSELSGGEQQRVAIARSLSNNPNIILADEPTGNLDESNEEKIMNIFVELKKLNKCVVVVTHNESLRKFADVILKMKDGKISEVLNEK